MKSFLLNEYGYKFHMNDVAATMGIEQLNYVGDTVQKHRANASAYNQAFSDLKVVRTLRHDNQHKGAYWLYTLRVKNPAQFMTYMKEKQIVTSAVHARNDTHTMFRDFKSDLPGVDEFVSEQVSIPVGWWLADQQRDYIIEAVRQYQA